MTTQTIQEQIAKLPKKPTSADWVACETDDDIANIYNRKEQFYEARVALLVRALERAAEKLRLYRAQHSGEYIGGPEYSHLMSEVEAVLAAVKP